MSFTKLYTTPIVCKGKREWFVFFRYWNGKDYTPKKISRAIKRDGTVIDLNRIKDLKERETLFKALREAREQWLLMGWNPLTDPKFDKRPTFEEDSFKEMSLWSLSNAFNHVARTKNLSDRSRKEYQRSVKTFIKGARALYIEDLPIGELRRKHIKAVFAWLKSKGISNKDYNKKLSHIKSLLSELDEWEAIEGNPAFRMKDLKVEQVQKFVTLTDEEKIIVREYLYIKHYRFFIYCLCCYFTGIRPDEILSLRIKDLDIGRGVIHLRPFSNVVKNKKERIVVVNERLLNYFKSMQLENYDPEFYIFSIKFEPGLKRNQQRNATNLWKKLVRNELGINKHLYSLKHLGADDLIAAGADEQSVVDHLSHSSRFITRRYTLKGLEKSREVIKGIQVEF